MLHCAVILFFWENDKAFIEKVQSWPFDGSRN